MPPPLAYFISFRTYGSWLHGDPRGSVDTEHNRPGTPLLPEDGRRQHFERCLLKHPPIHLDSYRRFAVDASIRAVCHHRRWNLHALHVRKSHVHCVVSAHQPPERVMNAFKSWSTRRMVECGLLQTGVKAWSRHGSTRYLHTSETFDRALRYTRDEQGPPLSMSRPSAWRDEWSAPA